MALVLPEKRVLALRLQQPDRVIGSFPKVQVVDGSHFGVNGKIIGVPHRNDSLRVLRNLGIKTAGLEPIRSYYRYPKLRGVHPPMEHQLRTAEFFTTHPKCFCLSTQRTGKTPAVIWAADFMMREHDVKGVLVITTMSCIRLVWENEVFSIVPHRKVAVLHGEKQRRIDRLSKRADYYVINHDGIKVITDELKEAIRSGRINLVVVDESAEFGDSKTERYDILKELCDLAPRVWCLTGTPMSRGPEYVWSQVRLVDPSRVPEFQAHWKHLTMVKVNKNKWIPRRAAKELVYAAMQPSIRFEKRDVLKNLPPITISDLEVPLSADQKSMITKLKKEGALRLSTGVMTVANAAVMLGKVLQICGGAVKVDDGTVHEVDVAPRMKELIRLLDGTDQKFIVLGSHQAIVDLLQKNLKTKYGTVWVDGRVTGTARERALNKFVTDPNCRGLVAHPKTIGHGLEFSVADTIVWWSPTHSPELYAQANERMASAAQKNPMGIYHLGAVSVEWKVYGNVSGKLQLQQSVLDMFKEFIDET